MNLLESDAVAAEEIDEIEQMIREYLAKIQREFERLVPPLSQSNPKLYARLQEARRQMSSKRT